MVDLSVILSCAAIIISIGSVIMMYALERWTDNLEEPQ
jgi:hypothetical protein